MAINPAMIEIACNIINYNSCFCHQFLLANSHRSNFPWVCVNFDGTKLEDLIEISVLARI